MKYYCKQLYERDNMKKTRTVMFVLSIMMFLCMAVSCAPAEAEDTVETSELGLSWSIYQKLNDWIYYVDFSTGKLWRVNAKGEERVQIGEDNISNFVIYGDQIFYIGGEGQELYTVNIDGSHKSFVYRLEDGYIGYKKMQILNGWIYILATHTPCMYRIKTDGSEGMYLETEGIGTMDFCIKGDKICYLDFVSAENGGSVQLWQMNTDGTEQQPLMQEVAEYGNTIDFDKNWIYYIDFDDSDIYKVSFDGNEKHRIVEYDGGDFLKVIDNWIYFEDGGDKSQLYKARTDGSERTLIVDARFAFDYFIWGNWLLSLEMDSISVIRVSESEKTDEIFEEIISDLPNVSPEVKIDRFE